MIHSLDMTTGLVVVCVVNISFGVGLLLLRSDRVWDGAHYWFVGNLFGLGSAILRLSYDGSWTRPIESALPATLMLVTNVLRIVAFVRMRQRLMAAAIGGGVVVLHLILGWIDDGEDQINLALGGAGFCMAILLSWQAYICYADLRWKRLRGRTLFVASTALMGISSAFAGVRALSVQPGTVIFAEDGPAQQNLLMVLAYIIIAHICLIAMLMDRLNRMVAMGQLRQRKESRLARQAEAHAREMSAIAHEKQSLLEVLIHEVRQPLNNAQAALQHTMMTLTAESNDYRSGQRFQAIIDKVVLSLTNAIVGASVVERKSQSRLVTADIVSVCQLACSDTGPSWESRIELDAGPDPILAQVDPVLLRLAVRNLIDNAIKHSAIGKRVTVTLNLAASHGAVAICVRNWPLEPFVPALAYFERGAQGSNASSEGRGLGLYIVREIAMLHSGSITGATNELGQTEFTLTIPI